ncbi:hypothetical protein B0A48_14352 [Cryoendolithus antarcticus]|uniref:Translocation protein sec66 n=1 Tax=Cryoendolithus antarcticus TaxID=1507870 RepID=A0A1V8SJQ8_9PEZI|nr:hypothetical protein B0A48_14352 [Cryoendolithus antarcticus]
MDDPLNATFNSTFNGTFANGTNSTSEPFTPSPPKPFWTNLLLPTLYLTILLTTLISFSRTYRSRQLQRAARLAPWFPSHTSRDIYLTLLHLEPSDEKSEKSTKVPESVLKAALLKRALEDIQRIVALRQAKGPLQALLQRGSVGEELWVRFQRAEGEMEAEVKEVVEEANAYVPGWGQVIFQSANEMNQNLLLKERTAELLGKVDEEKAWWEAKKQGVQRQFLKENGVESSEAVSSPEITGKRIETRSSDEDAVIVESGGPAQAQGGPGGGKKKGRK